MSLRELLAHLSGRKASGRLAFRQGDVTKDVTLADGQVINARSNLPREYLGQFLINVGLITEDQFHKAYETQRETKIYLGKILAMIGLVTEPQVLEALSLKFRETLLSAFPWKAGEFRFDPDPATLELEGVELRVPLEDILRDGEFRESAWQAIRAAFPSGRVRLALHPQKLAVPIKPGSVDAQIIEAIQDGLTLDEMVLALHATDFFLYQRLYALYRLEAVSILEELAEDPSPAPLRLALEPTPDEMVQTARALMADGNFTDALALATRAAEVSQAAAHEAFKREVEQTWLNLLRTKLLAVDAIAHLKVPLEELKRMALTAPQRYLLSRVDGLRTVRAIVQSSPIPELEALRAFKDFVDGHLVRLTLKAAAPRATG